MVQAKTAAASKETKPILFPEYSVVTYSATVENSEEFTSKEAKELLGWLEEPEGTDWKERFDILDENDKKVRLTHNVSNRPFNSALAQKYKQEMLAHRWQLNGETMSITRTGDVGSGQHRLVALVLAEQAREKDDYLKGLWSTDQYPNGVTIPTTISYGISDEDEVINTIDNVQPRTPADMIYRSELLSSIKSKEQRREAAKALDFAVRTVWDRTGASDDPYGAHKTHGEVMDFIKRHPGLVRSVKKMVEENKNGGLSQFIKPGYAGGLHYLFSAADSDREKYYGVTPHVEKKADFGQREKADKFFVELLNPTGNSKIRTPITEVIGALVNAGGGKPVQRVAVLIQAWNRWVSDEPVTKADLKLEYNQTETGTELAMPTIGGIDLGSKKDQLQYKRDKAAEAKTAEHAAKEAAKAAEKAAKEAAKVKAEKDKKAAEKTAAKGKKPAAEVIAETDEEATGPTAEELAEEEANEDE